MRRTQELSPLSAWLSLIGFGAFLVGSSCAGAHLLFLARRTRQLPELLLGGALLACGPLGHGLVVVGRLLDPSPGSLGTRLVEAGAAGLTLGAAALFVFTWRTFRSHQPAARFVLMVLLALVFTSGAGDVAHRSWVDIDGDGPVYWAASVLRASAFFWMSLECWLLFRRLRRRAPLGVTAAGRARRILWWSFASACAGGATALWLAVQAWTGASPAQLPWANGCVSLLALGAAVATWIAFVPVPAQAWPLFQASRART